MRRHLIGAILLLYLVIFACKPMNQGKVEEGSKLFKVFCVNCHGISGSLMTNGAKDLRYSILNLEERILVISQGRNAMTAFQNTLTTEQIVAVAKYTFQLADSSIHAK